MFGLNAMIHSSMGGQNMKITIFISVQLSFISFIWNLWQYYIQKMEDRSRYLTKKEIHFSQLSLCAKIFVSSPFIIGPMKSVSHHIMFRYPELCLEEAQPIERISWKARLWLFFYLYVEVSGVMLVGICNSVTSIYFSIPQLSIIVVLCISPQILVYSIFSMTEAKKCY